MKSFIAMITLALAVVVAANPAPVAKRQGLGLPSIVCIPDGSSLSAADDLFDDLETIATNLGVPFAIPNVIACGTGETCNGLTILGLPAIVGTCAS